MVRGSLAVSSVLSLLPQEEDAVLSGRKALGWQQAAREQTERLFFRIFSMEQLLEFEFLLLLVSRNT